MKRILFIFICLVTFTRTFAQLCEEKVTYYGDNFDFVEFHRIIRTSDQAFLMVGYKNEEAFIQKVDGCGNLIWEKTYSYGTEQAFRDVVEVNNRIIVTGYCQACRMGDSGQKIIVHELNSQGEEAKAVKFLGPVNKDADAYRIRRISDNRFAVSGYQGVSQGNLSGKAMYAALLADDLATNTVQFFSLKALDETAYDIVELTGGGFVLAGKSGQSSNPVMSSIRLVGASAIMAEQWSQELFIAFSGKEQSASAIEVHPNGDLYIAGSKLESDHLQLFVARCNPFTGAIKGQNTFGGTGDDFAKTITILSPNDIVISGLFNQTGLGENPLALSVNSNLVKTFEYKLAATQGLFNGCVGFIENNVHHYAFTGGSLGLTAKGIFARTVSLQTAIDDDNALSAAITVFPNPAQDYLIIQGLEGQLPMQFKMTDLHGRIVRSGSAQSRIELPELPEGTYLLELFTSQARVTRLLQISNR